MKSIKESFVTDAINIKTYPLSDYDNIVVMFSRERGLIKGIAKGVKRPKSKLGARMQMLVANKIMLKNGRNFDTICEAQALNTFNKLRTNLDKLTYSMYLTEIISSFCTDGDEENTNNEKIYELFYGILENIANSQNKTEILLNVIKFQLKFMSLIGLGAELKVCLKCGCKLEDGGYFSVASGGVVCKDCKGGSDIYIGLHKKIREFLIAQQNSQINSKTQYDSLVDENFCNKCFLLLKKYTDSQSSRPARALRVLENMT